MKTEDPARPRALGILVRPSQARDAEQMEALMHASYGTSPEDPDQVFTAAMFRQHQQTFPEGQFVAIDPATDRVVGLTVSMRMHLNPARPLDAWWKSTGYG